MHVIAVRLFHEADSKGPTINENLQTEVDLFQTLLQGLRLDGRARDVCRRRKCNENVGRGYRVILPA